MASQEDSKWQEVRYPPMVNADGEPTRLYPYQCNICCLFLTAGIDALEDHVAEHRSKLRARLEALQHEESGEAGHMWDYLGGPPSTSSIPMLSSQQHIHAYPQNIEAQSAWYSASGNRANSWPPPPQSHGAISAAGPVPAGLLQGLPYGGSSTTGRMVYTGTGAPSSYTSHSESQLGQVSGPSEDGSVTELQDAAYRNVYIPNTADVHIDHVYLSGGDNGAGSGGGRNVMYYGASYGPSTELHRHYRLQAQPDQRYTSNSGYDQQDGQPAFPAKRARLLETPVSVQSTTAPTSFTDPPHPDGQVDSVEPEDPLQTQAQQQDGSVDTYAELTATQSSNNNTCQHLPTKVDGQWNQSGQTRMFPVHETVDVTTIPDSPSASIIEQPMEQHLNVKRDPEHITDNPSQHPPPPSLTPVVAATPNGNSSRSRNHGESAALTTDSGCFERSDTYLPMGSTTSELPHSSHTVDIQQQDAQSWIKFLGQCSEAGSKQHEELYATDTVSECTMSSRTHFSMKVELRQDGSTTTEGGGETAIDELQRSKEESHPERTDKFRTNAEAVEPEEIRRSSEEVRIDVNASSSATKTQAEEIIDAILNSACVKEEETEQGEYKAVKLCPQLSAGHNIIAKAEQNVEFSSEAIESIERKAAGTSVEPENN
ncbi:hypothetical protein BIW11_13616 [Tropilaelaps mercedesae]|uniref:Uncharacterized protein n=1 Tax=Tropilaelaps mercedesae TaxID=418985 RepID=A0A1V9X175_9ACAR|nr:hypothetical protein BIW11_13616 [Tropilaelaps mercedesae]